jgi:beta-N-acetylhexosaminidase
LKRIFGILCVSILLCGSVLPAGQVQASTNQQTNPYNNAAKLIFDQMTSEERVGQVFLVTFQGTKITADSQITELIQKKHIGGILLDKEDDNFVGPENTISTLRDLTANLQRTEWSSSQSFVESSSNDIFIPLFIGVSQEGDSYPNDQILNEITTLPDLMAIGATWNTDNAKKVGTILGRELQAVGINLFLGPSLDVLDTIRADNANSLGVRTFGGDPYWVGEMGKAYIQGVHEGSANQVAVIAKHFPGQGESDRKPEEEIPTVRKSLEQLKQIELAPFFAVTGNADQENQTADGLLVSHIRYQGFQGNIRATTKPISFDATALNLILSLPQFQEWHTSGGLIISDDLGSQAVRKFYDPMNNSFDAKSISRNALMAGNDLLFMGHITSATDTDSYTSLVKTIDFFVQKYDEDPAFKERVDQAVMKILEEKLNLYPQFTINAIIPTEESATLIGTGKAEVSSIAQQAVTLISPDQNELNDILPNAPQYEDHLIFISDVIQYRQCSSCTDQEIFPANSLRNSVTHLYGSGFGDLIQSARMTSYSLDNLRLLLEQATGSENIQRDLVAADWIVIAFTDLNAIPGNKDILQRFFTERPDLIRNKKLIGMSFNAPYFLDATDISKFSAYYAFYSKIPDFYDTAARVLFQELIPSGHLPVSVSGVGYDLINATSPDPQQVIPVMIDPSLSPGVEVSTPSADNTAPLAYKVGDSIPIVAGPIFDHNGNLVPNGTLVKFVIDTRNASGSLEQIEMQTREGLAMLNYVIPSVGTLEISVTSDPAMSSQILRFDITESGGTFTSIEPTEPEVIIVEVTPTPATTEEPEPDSFQKHAEGRLDLTDWLVSMAIIFTSCFILNWSTRKKLSVKWNVLLTLSTGAGGFLAYFLVVLGFLNSEEAIKRSGTGYLVIWLLIGSLLGAAIALSVYFISRKRKSSP